MSDSNTHVGYQVQFGVSPKYLRIRHPHPKWTPTPTRCPCNPGFQTEMCKEMEWYPPTRFGSRWLMVQDRGHHWLDLRELVLSTNTNWILTYVIIKALMVFLEQRKEKTFKSFSVQVNHRKSTNYHRDERSQTLHSSWALPSAKVSFLLSLAPFRISKVGREQSGGSRTKDLHKIK